MHTDIAGQKQFQETSRAQAEGQRVPGLTKGKNLKLV